MCIRDRLCIVEAMSHQEESQSTPALIHVPESIDEAVASCSLGMIPENNLLESCTRLSISLEENGLFKVSTCTNAVYLFVLYIILICILQHLNKRKMRELFCFVCC